MAARLNLDGPDDAGPRWFRSNQFESLSAGTYDFTADAVGYLPAYCVGKAVAAPQTTLAAGELVAGDVNDERVIVILDAVAVGAAFGNPSVNPAADLSDDGQVNVLDLILVLANFGKVPSSWTCWWIDRRGYWPTANTLGDFPD